MSATHIFLIFSLIESKILYFCRPQARVAELVDALDSKSSSFGSAGSIPASSTKGLSRLSRVGFFYFGTTWVQQIEVFVNYNKFAIV